MNKLVLFNLVIQLFTIYLSFADVTDVPFSEEGQTIRNKFANGETTVKSEKRRTTTKSAIGKIAMESSTTEATTESTIRETTAQFSTREIATEPATRETATESTTRETTTDSAILETTTKFTTWDLTTTESATTETIKESTTRKITTRESAKRTTNTKFATMEVTTEPAKWETPTESATRATHTESGTMEIFLSMMETLCPSVDICAANSSSADLKPTGVVRLGRVSCCRGCSCHADCNERMNCCYPKDNEALNGIKQESSQYQCLHTRISLDRQIDGAVPAYRTIVKPPTGGCVDSRPVRVTKDVLLYPTCDDIDITPLGPYCPVFSPETGDIYRNIICARCHGIHNTESFNPKLVCHKDGKTTQSQISMTENLGFLESKVLSPNCHVDFKLASPVVIKSKRCFRDLITNCTVDNITYINIPKIYKDKLSGLNFGVIRDLCENGLVSPTLKDKLLYKNVFCAMCSTTSIDQVLLLCEEDKLGRILDKSFTFFLDLKIMHTVKKTRTKKNHPIACMSQRETKIEVCRKVRCPSGKIQNKNGDCILVGNFASTDGLRVVIKLTTKETIGFNEQDKAKENKRLSKTILKNNMWPIDWKVSYIMRRSDQTECKEMAVALVHLVSKNKDTESVYRDVQKTIQLAWEIEWKNETYRLTQSIMDYRITWTYIGNQIKDVPTWQAIQSIQNVSTSYSDCGLMEWEFGFVDKSIYKEQYVLNRLHFCDQIEMMSEEFILGPDNAYLESNLTKRVLFDMEFDLIEKEDGLNSRVCLEDTIFSTTKANEARALVQTHTTILILVSLSFAFYI